MDTLKITKIGTGATFTFSGTIHIDVRNDELVAISNLLRGEERSSLSFMGKYDPSRSFDFFQVHLINYGKVKFLIFVVTFNGGMPYVYKLDVTDYWKNLVVELQQCLVPITRDRSMLELVLENHQYWVSRIEAMLNE